MLISWLMPDRPVILAIWLIDARQTGHLGYLIDWGQTDFVFILVVLVIDAKQASSWFSDWLMQDRLINLVIWLINANLTARLNYWLMRADGSSWLSDWWNGRVRLLTWCADWLMADRLHGARIDHPDQLTMKGARHYVHFQGELADEDRLIVPPYQLIGAR
jgi:hypothetical protein